jgi:transcriptional repressor NrdR
MVIKPKMLLKGLICNTVFGIIVKNDFVKYEVFTMKCPFCNFEESKVIDSRPTDEGERIRRRRECMSCAKRFTTYEIIESVPIVVVKKDKSREVFDRDKLFNGMMRACEKRPVSVDVIEKAIDEIEAELQNSLDREVTSVKIGEYVMDKLKDIDEVAYVRFASVYRQFKDINTFMSELKKLLIED